jgi:hypothetical protein
VLLTGFRPHTQCLSRTQLCTTFCTFRWESRAASRTCFRRWLTCGSRAVRLVARPRRAQGPHRHPRALQALPRGEAEGSAKRHHPLQVCAALGGGSGVPVTRTRRRRSAGIGRTGSFMLCDTILEYLAAFAKEDKVPSINVFNTLLELRKLRPGCVQTTVRTGVSLALICLTVVCARRAGAADLLLQVPRVLYRVWPARCQEVRPGRTQVMGEEQFFAAFRPAQGCAARLSPGSSVLQRNVT